MLSKSALTGDGQNRWSPLEAFLGLKGGILGGAFFFYLPIGTDNTSGAFWGRKMVSVARVVRVVTYYK